ncbi:MAG TPA: adenine phosphoribosyltransferase [Phycisphaerae bacterium]|nr:adenine phosphoribosyltransferase [Phycisphaerae bacterium]
MIDIASIIRDIPDFPKEGIIFKDITPLLGDPEAMRQTADRLAAPFLERDIDAVCGVEARGWIFGALLAERLAAAFVPIRKPGKLPYKKIARTYDLEYGTNTIEIHIDAIQPGQKVLMVDDLLATGGTMAAACGLIEELGGEVVACAFVIELCFLSGRQKLGNYEIFTLLEVKG